MALMGGSSNTWEGRMNQIARVKLPAFSGQLVLVGCTASPESPVDQQGSIGTDELHLVRAEGSRHQVHVDAPQLVLDAGRETVLHSRASY